MIGVYGVLAYLVTLRRHEFGVRLALCAQPGNLLRLVLGQGLGLAAIGITIGLAGAVMLTQVLETLLFGVSTRDPMTFLDVAILLAVAVLIACYASARRAARSDPMAALRAESPCSAIRLDCLVLERERPQTTRAAPIAEAVNAAAFFLTNSCTLTGRCPVNVSTSSDIRS